MLGYPPERNFSQHMVNLFLNVSMSHGLKKTNEQKKMLRECKNEIVLVRKGLIC